MAVQGAGAVATVGEADFAAGGAGLVDGGAIAAGAGGIADVVPVVGDGVTLGSSNERALARMWLLTHLPGLNEQDIAHYSRSLIDMGFYSQDILAIIMLADLGIMRPAHCRFMECRMNGGDPNHAMKIE